MKTVDFKCGKCKTLFPVQIKAYLERFSGNERAYLANKIHCPSCQTEMPHELRSAFYDMITADNKDGWEIGTNFLAEKP